MRAYLESSGGSWAISLRELIRGLDYESFVQRYSTNGRAPYHPALMLGLISCAMQRGASSLRQVEAFARENVGAWWLTGGACPDHSSIGRFILRFGDLLSGPCFEELTAKILKATGTSGTDLAGDGTTVASMASRFRLLSEEAAREHAGKLRERAEAAGTQHREALLKEAEKYERAAEAACREVKQTGRKGKKRSVKVALADPEATNQKLKNGLPAPSYKPTALANEARIVVAHSVQSSSENEAVRDLCQQAKRVSQTNELECLRLDNGFLSADVVDVLLEENVDNPLISTQAVVADKRGSSTPKYFPKSDFVHDPETDTLKCPANKTLKLIKHRKTRQTKIYGGAPCGDCPLRDRCTRSRTGREVHVYESRDPKLNAMRHVMSHPLARADYVKRSAMIEPVFADMRARGFNRFLRAGLEKVRIEFALVCMAHNLARYLALRAGACVEAAQRGLRLLSGSGGPETRSPAPQAHHAEIPWAPRAVAWAA